MPVSYLDARDALPALQAAAARVFTPDLERAHSFIDRLCLDMCCSVAATGDLLRSTPELFAAMVARTQVVPEGVYLLSSILRVLAEEGYAHQSADGWSAGAPLPPNCSAELQTEARASCPESLASFELIEHCRLHAWSFLTGLELGVQVLFPRGDMSLWIRWHSQDPTSALYADLMAPALDAVLQPGDSILEFGAGVGAVIERALPLLKRHQAATYWFTDLGAMFVQQARRRYQGEDILRFSTVDLNRPLEGQGFPPGSLNVLSAVNTAHVAKDLPATARSLYDSLATPGWLLLGEASPPNKHALARQDLIAGFLPGWWDVIIDPLLRPRPGFLLPSEWEAILRGAGFSTVACIPGERTFTGPCRGGVILAGKGTSGPGA